MQRISIFLVAFLFPIQLFSLQNKFEYLTPDNGLSQANVECIYQDSRGFIWIGTFNGLNRYDGYEIRIFKHDPDDTLSLSHEHVSYICEDAEGKLWLATYGGGVSIYYPETETFRRIEDVRIGDQTITLRQINYTVIDTEGNIWVIDENQGIFVFNTDLELIKVYRNDPQNPASVPASFYFGLVFDKEGNGWFGVGNNMLCFKEKNSDDFEVFLFEDRVSAADDGIKSMYIDRLGNIWIGTTSQGAYQFNPETRQFINYRKESDLYKIEGNTIMSFAEDWEGNILIGTDGGGINIIDNNTGQINAVKYDPGNPESLNSNAIYAIYFDHSQNMWVGTYSAGVNFQSRYKNKFLKYIPNPLDPNSLSYKNVTAFLEDRDGEIWIGTDGGGLNRFNPTTGKFEHFRMDPSNPDWLQTDVIIHLMEDDEGDIFISSYNHGLTIFNKNLMTFKQYLPDPANPASIAGIHPWFTLQDSYGTIWVGMLAVGLDKFDKASQTFQHYVSVVADSTTLNSPNIKVMYEDKDIRLWIGTEGGGLHLFNREEDNFTRYIYDPSKKNTVSNNDIRAMHEDTKGRFWIGTGNGLCLMNRDSGIFKPYYVEDGLPGNTINGILEDNNGNLWLSTDAGISKFNPDKMTFRNYNKTDGLQGNEFNYTASIIASDGTFYFGGKNGFNSFRPEEILDNPNPPRIILTGIDILNEPYTRLPVRKRGKTTDIAVTQLKSLKFSYKQNILTFKFAALDYGNSVKNQYKYMLVGFDKAWNNTDANKRYASYTNLPGGDYVLRVIASNGDGIWNEEGLAIEITITPPFYKRTWFILLILAGIVWFVVRYIRRREEVLKRDKEILESKIQEGLREVNKQKEEVALKDKVLQEKIESEKEQNWYNIGMAKMSNVMSRNKDNLEKLAQSIITEMVEYLEVQQGAIYLLNDDDENNKFLELMSAYAPDDKRLTGTRVGLDEGQVGTCFKEMSVVKIDNLPDDYAHFSSGLGESSLKHMALIPLRLNEIVIGVVELLSFTPVPQYRIEFVEKSGETLTSILTALKANVRTQLLLEKQKMQAEELTAQEEELRQNLEEMQATQEELARVKEIDRKKEEERKEAEKKYLEQLQKQNEELNFEKSLIDALLANVPNSIYFKDRESKFLKASASMAKLFNLKSIDELIGKSDFDFFDDEHAKPAYKDEQTIIKTEKPILNYIEKEVKKDGTVSYVNSSKMPLYDKSGKVIGTFGISTDISESKQMEAEIKMRNEELLAQEEELRQNLEEMQTTQEELLRMKEIEQKNEEKRREVERKFTEQLKSQNEELKNKQAALEKEEYLFNALLDSANEHIYFKDKKSRFIRLSRSMIKLFKVKSFKDLIGKSDFDFFDKAHARPAFEDEQGIIKSGKPIIDLIEKEVHKDGSISWVSTSKLPLKDKQGNIVGTWGMSKDVTVFKQLEAETLAANEKLEIEKIMFTALMDNIAARITYKDTEARHIRINKTKTEALGLKDQSEVFGKTDPEVFGDTHTIERLKKEIEQIKTGVSSYNIEELFKQKDGSLHWGDTSRVPLKNKKGEIIGGLVITWDITKNKNIQFMLEQANDLLRSFSEVLPVIIFNTDDKGNISEIKGEGLKLLELKDRKTAAQKLFSLFPDIKKTVSDKKGKDLDKFSGKVKINKSEFNFKYLLIRSKTTTRGYSGYILIEKT